jgi:DNA-binding transcriptional regulator GbsR (MarR family)
MTGAVDRLIAFLGDLGPRWGLPAEPCCVHGYLYLHARPVSEQEICTALNLDRSAVESALAWLCDYRLVEGTSGGEWRTDSDPWELMVRALDQRRQREAGPALDILRACRSEAAADRDHDPVIYRQIHKLLALAEDLSALDQHARRLSPKTLRQMVGIGGRAARFLDRTFGGGRNEG